MEFCESCLVAEPFGLFQLHTPAGEHIAAWWSCAECADRDAAIHDERGLVVSMIVPLIEASW